jgi:hypothetical protein
VHAIDPRRALVRALLRAAGIARTRALALVGERASEDKSRAVALGADPERGRDVVAVDGDGERGSESLRSMPARVGDGSTGPRMRSKTARDLDGAPARPVSGATPREADRRSAFRDAWAFDGAPTAAGGVLFLVPVLARIGYAQWLDAHAEWTPFDLAQRVLAAALARLGVPSEDVAWSLAESRVTRRIPPRRFVAPAMWREGLCAGSGATRTRYDKHMHTLLDLSGRLLLGAWRDSGDCPLLRAMRASVDAAVEAGDEAIGTRGEAIEAGDEVIDADDEAIIADDEAIEADDVAIDLDGAFVQHVANAWLVASRRWLRRHARIGLADLVLRPAALALTPTHVDVSFDLAHADLRVRRAGLDLDPGWVPWLGRVLTFHYGRVQ